MAFPPEFYAAKDELRRFCSVNGRSGSLLESEVDLRRASEGLPTALVPFMTVEEPSWPDVYAFDFSTSPRSVVLWSDHAIVKRWESFEKFCTGLVMRAN
jgi:hypothetical protein